MASKSNRRNQMGVDRIGTLPDAVLCYILSFLPTLYAVHTSILSKRWNKLWTSLPILEFHDDMVLYSSWNKSRFLKFVGRVIALHDSADIRKLSLSVKEHYLKDKDLDRIESWICTAIKRNLVELDLTLWNDEEPFLMPQSLFVCKTLTVLKVDSQYVTYHLPKTGCFPSLKVLCVSLHDPYDDSFINLFTCCPILEDLTIKGILGDCLPNINISAPELRILRIYLEMDSCGYPECKFFINAPKMENFDISDDYFWSHYILENGESIVNAEIRLQNRYDEKDDSLCFADRTAAILAKIYNVRYLSFDAHLFQEASYLPDFVCLSRLVLNLYGRSYWELLIEFLRRSPILGHLVLELKGDEWYSEGDEREWNFFNPPEVPVCLSSHLKTISIKGFKGHLDEMEVANYFLQNGKVLNSMTIACTKAPCSTEGLKSCLVKFI